MGEEVSEELQDLKTASFVYQFVSKGNTYRLRVPLKLPFEGNAREYAVRLVAAHRIPCHLEDDLCKKLQEFSREATLEMMDKLAERKFYGGSVFEKGSETDQIIHKWTKSFTETHAEFFSAPVKEKALPDASNFSEIYHKLIHSPALETLLQLENTYAMAVDDVYRAWENAKDLIQKKHDTDLANTMKSLGTSKSEYDINLLMKQHVLEHDKCEARWSNELHQLQESQRTEYRDWMATVFSEMESYDRKDKKPAPFLLAPPKARSIERSFSPASSSDGLIHNIDEATTKEESFTIYLGSQLKTMHNIRMIRDDTLSFCRHKQRGVAENGAGLNPERLQTSMSLYSDKLSAIVVMVDGRVSSSVGLREELATVCRRSTEFHFPTYDQQLSTIQENTILANLERKEEEVVTSSTSTSSSSPSQDTPQEYKISDPAYAFSQRPLTTPTSPYMGDGASGSEPELTAGTGVWSGGGGGGGGRGEGDQGKKQAILQPGDFYLTRHSNLSKVHAVFHLVTDEKAIMSNALKSRHLIMTGLKNCLYTATRHDFYNITVPLFLVHTMQPEMTINWCMKRAEMVFKFVKGFMLENTAWSQSGARTIQFLIPTGISTPLFDDICAMVNKVFRVAPSRNLKTRRSTFTGIVKT